jgi:hypothetical protein
MEKLNFSTLIQPCYHPITYTFTENSRHYPALLIHTLKENLTNGLTKLTTHIQNVLSLNLSGNKDYTVTEAFHGFPPSVRENARILPRLGHYCFLQNHHSSFIPPFKHSLKTADTIHRFLCALWEICWIGQQSGIELYSVQISVGTLVTLTEAFSGFPQSPR